MGLYDPRRAEVGVVLDLMIHDIDIVLFLVSSPIKRIDAIGTNVLSKSEDIANARINFANGCVVNISASRISLEKFRKIRIFQKNAYISLDYVKPTLKIYKKKKKDIRSMRDISLIKPTLKKTEPLKEELKHFIHCVVKGKKPVVSGEHGRNALEVCLEILRKISR